jgi:hypothetical protein
MIDGSFSSRRLMVALVRKPQNRNRMVEAMFDIELPEGMSMRRWHKLCRPKGWDRYADIEEIFNQRQILKYQQNHPVRTTSLDLDSGTAMRANPCDGTESDGASIPEYERRDSSDPRNATPQGKDGP